MHITKEKAIEALQKLPDGTALYFYLIPNNGKEEDGDENDIELNFADTIYSGGLDNDEPFIDFGFQVGEETDISHFQDLLR